MLLVFPTISPDHQSIASNRRFSGGEFFFSLITKTKTLTKAVGLKKIEQLLVPVRLIGLLNHGSNCRL
jgi:hypothetical protein